MKKGIIYCHIFPNSKCYVGKTERTVKRRSGSDFREYGRDNEHSAMWRAIQKYGAENIRTEILYENVPVSCLNTLRELQSVKRGHILRNVDITKRGVVMGLIVKLHERILWLPLSMAQYAAFPKVQKIQHQHNKAYTLGIHTPISVNAIKMVKL